MSETVSEALMIEIPEAVIAETARAREADRTYGFCRSKGLRFLETTVSITPDRTPGTLNFSCVNTNPNREFVLADVVEFSGPEEFRHRLRGVDEVTIFVHGYKATQTEVAFRAAQLTHDIEIPGSALIYSWPCRAKGTGYAYDLDSPLFARDRLEQTISGLKSVSVYRVILIAHSMGSALVMGTIGQAELWRPGWPRKNLVRDPDLSGSGCGFVPKANGRHQISN